MTLDLSPDIFKPKHLSVGLLFILVHILSFYFAESENFTATKQLDHFNATGNSKSFYVHASNFTNKSMSNKTMPANDTQEYLTEQRSDVPVTKDYSTKQISDRAKDYLINQRLSNGSGSTNTEMIRDNITSKIDGITQANVVATVQNKVGESSQNERNETVNGITTGKMMEEGSGGRIEMSSSVIRLTTGKKVETRDGMTSASSTTATTTLIKPESESDVIIKYNCMRSGMSCQNNGMCATDGGYCSCPNGVHGYDCSVGKESIIDKCNPPCQNGGTCYTGQNLFKSNTLSTRCFCTEAYYGNTCQHNRVHHKCSHNSMEIVIAPIVNTADQFKGSVYVKGHEDDPNCVFIPERNGYSVLRRVLQFTDCGNAINETDNGKTVMTFQIVVRYDEILLDTDEELSFMCHVTPVEGSSYVWQTWMIAQDDVRSHSRHRKIFTGTRQPIDMEIQTADGRPLTDPQQLGTILTLKFTLDERSGYESFRVEQISVSNGVSGSKRHSIQLVADNCPTPDALEVKKVIVSFMKTTPNIVMLQFRVFKLRYSNQLFFESLLKICAVGNDCSNKECPRTNRTVRFRMKRHEDSNFGETIYESTNVSLTVLYPDSNGSNTSSNNVEQDNSNASSVWNERCSRTTVFIIFIVSAVAIIVALTTILLTTCFRISYKRI